MISWGRRKSQSKGILGISASKQGIALTYCSEPLPTPQFRFCEFYKCPPSKQEEKLSAIIAKHLLQGTECRYMLDPSEYRLLLLDAPSVPEDEMRTAARWLVKDLIDFPVSEASVDTFPVPVRSGQAAKIYVVVCRQKRVLEILQMTKIAGLNLVQIGVPELAIRDVLSWVPDISKGVALLSLGKKMANLLVVRDNLLYLSRPIDENPLEEDNKLESEEESEKKIEPEKKEEEKSSLAPENEAPAAESQAAPGGGEVSIMDISRSGQVKLGIAENAAPDSASAEPVPASKLSSPAQGKTDYFSVPNLALEIERSFDYYQSQLGQQAPVKLYIAPSLYVNDSLVAEMGQTLSIQVEKLDINQYLSFVSPVEGTLQAQCLFAIAGAVSARKLSDETTN